MATLTIEPEAIPVGLRHFTLNIQNQYRDILENLTTRVDDLAKTTVLLEHNELLGTELGERFRSSSWAKFMGNVDDMKQSSLTRLNQINNPIQQAAAAYNDQAKDLQETQEKLAAEIEALGKSKESMLQVSQTAKQTNEYLVAAQQEHARATKESAELGNEYRQKSKRNKDLEFEVRQLKTVDEEKSKNLKNLQRHHDNCVDHHKDNVALQKELQDCKDNAKHIVGQYNELKARVNELSAKNTELTKENGGLKAQLAEAKAAAKTDLGKELNTANLQAQLELQKVQNNYDHEKQRADNCENARKTQWAEAEKKHGEQLAAVHRELAEYYDRKRKKDQDEAKAQRKRADDCVKERRENENQIADLEEVIRMYSGTPAQPTESQPTQNPEQLTGGRPITTPVDRLDRRRPRPADTPTALRVTPPAKRHAGLGQGKGPATTFGEDLSQEEEADLYGSGSPPRTVRGPQKKAFMDSKFGTTLRKWKPGRKSVMGVSYHAPTGDERQTSSGADAPARNVRGETPTEQRRPSGFQDLTSQLSRRRLSEGASSLFGRLLGGESRQTQTRVPAQQPEPPPQPVSSEPLARQSNLTLRRPGSQVSLAPTTASTRAARLSRGDRILDALEQPPHMTFEQLEELRGYVQRANEDLSQVLDRNAEFSFEEKRCIRADQLYKNRSGRVKIQDGKCEECKKRNHKLCFSVAYSYPGATVRDSELKGSALTSSRKTLSTKFGLGF